MEKTKEVVIIGGGFAGVNLVNHLANISGFHITLVDKNNYNLFYTTIRAVWRSSAEVKQLQTFRRRCIFRAFLPG